MDHPHRNIFHPLAVSRTRPGSTALSSSDVKTAPSEEVQVHRYRAGDELGIVPFLERYMGWPSAMVDVPHVDHWRWKFLSNPLGFHLVCVAERDCQVVSHSASLPTRMKVGERTVIASQGVDLVTDPDYRGHGLIGQTMGCRNQIKDEHSVALDFGFPNPASYQLSIKKQGFHDLSITILQHRYIVDSELFFSKVRYGHLKRIGYRSLEAVRRSRERPVDVGQGTVVEDGSGMSEELDHLYEMASKDFDLMIVRDRAHLAWRYGDPRAGKFIVRTVRHQGVLAGYMVHKVEERDGTRFLNIVDYLMDPQLAHLHSVLISDCISLAQGLKIETVLCCLPQGHPYGERLAEAGFRSEVRYTGERPMSVIALERDGSAGLMDVLQRKGLKAHIMLGDTDWV